MASSSSSPQERSIASPKLYDAFISHRGPDVKETLAKQLYHLLRERGCRAFLDREEIEGGDSIPAAIHNGICSSVVQIAIFSPRYAESSWCLDELVLMLQQTDALFIPVFYNVQPWELRYIDNENDKKKKKKKKTSQYAAAFSDYERKRRNLDKLDEWKKALASAADISGYELSQNQGNFCEEIVSRVIKEVQKKIPLDVAKYPVGLAELVEEFERSCSKTAGIVGIFGLGGSGKTTLAKELFNTKRSGYTESCFLPDVRESHARSDLHSLQSQLFKDLFHEDRKFKNIDEGIGQLKHCLGLGRARNLHFLIILDDIDHEDQLDALLPEGMLSSGSLVIITTRNKSVLRGADSCYKMQALNRDHAKNLFCSHAFPGQNLPIAYEKLVESFVKFCGGLPLSLKVLGAHVYKRDECYWESELEKAKKIPPADIMKRLKISFDGLDKEEKQIFIDIACLFNKKGGASDFKSSIITNWKASGWSAEHAVQTLEDKCLLEPVEKDNYGLLEKDNYGLLAIDDDGLAFQMHDHLRDLGRQMADELGTPRLWRPDILRSMESKGFKHILAETKGRCFNRFYDESLGIFITYFIAEHDLLWLEIGFIHCIPSWIPLRKLHVLYITFIEEMWSTFQKQLQSNIEVSFDLRRLIIYKSPSLQKLPDLIEMFSHLEELVIAYSAEMTDVTSLVQSLKQLSNLRYLELEGGFSGGNLDSSTSSRMTSLETLRLSLPNVSKLLITGEICHRLQSLTVTDTDDLNEINLKRLERLKKLWVGDCSKLETISVLSSLTGLQSLEVRRCRKLETISGLSSLAGLQLFEAEECEGLKSLRTFAHLRHLERMQILECGELQSVEGVEELAGLRSLVIKVPDDENAWVRNCIYGLRSLPSERTILIQELLDDALSKLNKKLFSGVISTQAVVEIERGDYDLEMRSSSSAITIYVLHVNSGFINFESEYPYYIGLYMGDYFLTILLTQRDSVGTLEEMTIKKGYKATVKVEEEEKALTILQRIVDRLYGQEWYKQELAAYNVVKRKRKQKHREV